DPTTWRRQARRDTWDRRGLTPGDVLASLLARPHPHLLRPDGLDGIASAAARRTLRRPPPDPPRVAPRTSAPPPCSAPRTRRYWYPRRPPVDNAPSRDERRGTDPRGTGVAASRSERRPYVRRTRRPGIPSSPRSV